MEREDHSKAAGLRTIIMICFGSIEFTELFLRKEDHQPINSSKRKVPRQERQYTRVKSPIVCKVIIPRVTAIFFRFVFDS
jgi:uncharacterized membrane protein YhiD involved in acid resistance